MESAVVPVVDDIGGAEERVAQDGHGVVLDGAEDAAVVVGLLPDKVAVRDADGGVAKLEVERALEGDDAAVDGVLAGRLLDGRGEGREELCEERGGQRADGVARVEQERLGLGQDGDLRAVLAVDDDAITVGPVAHLAVGRGAGGDDVLLDKGTLELLGVDATKHGGTTRARHLADIQRESTAVDELLLKQVVEDVGV